MLTYEALAQFCAEQFASFDARQWLERMASDGPLVALAAKYLSMTSWYGYESELAAIAADADAMIASAERFNSEAQARGFDLTRFSIAVRCRIAAREKKCPAPCGEPCRIFPDLPPDRACTIKQPAAQDASAARPAA